MFFNVYKLRGERVKRGTTLMPKYYLHLWDGDLLDEDREGIDLPNLAAARDEAMKFAQQIGCDLEAPDRALVEVADEEGSTLWMIQLCRDAGAATRRITH